MRRIILSILIAGIILSGSLFVWFSASPRHDRQEVFITQGMVPKQVAETLENNRVIRSAFFFRVLLKLRGTSGSLVPGEYRFEKRQSVFKVASRVTKGDFGMEQRWVTIPEGSTNEMVADLIKEKFPDFDKDTFLLQAEGKQGYLFPETYQFVSTSTESMLEKLTDTFDYQVRSLQADALNANKDWNDVVVMASILEEEADTEEDFAIVSGILWKRLSIGMPLQVDVSPVTYQEKGLPARPLSNPGLQTLQAALNPADSSHLYYLTGRDGMMHYAETYEEHKQNIERYLK
jgi:UPF0755 protein